MNRRIRKKKDKKITEAIRQFVKRCEALYEQQRKEELTQ